MNATPIDGGKTARALERAKNAAYKRRRETMADYHEAEAAMWRDPSVKNQEAVDVARSEARKARGAYDKAREQLDQAQALRQAA